MNTIRYHALETLNDDYLEPYLDLFQTAFPLNEQVKVSTFIRALKSNLRTPRKERVLLCALEGKQTEPVESARLLGMAYFEVLAQQQCAFLWYLAVDPAQRNAGIGSEFYREIVRCALSIQPDLQAIVYEVERPDQAHNPEIMQLAERRIRFYQRLGGRLATIPLR